MVKNPRPCRRCGNPVPSVSPRASYCSDYCRRKYQDERRKAERREAKDLGLNARPFYFCPVCGVPYQQKNHAQLFCSPRCRNKAEYARKKGHALPIAQPVVLAVPYWEPEGEELTANTIPEAWPDCLPCGLTTCPDESIGGPMACQTCPRSLFWEG